jgi:dihydroneopterin aldolase
MNGLIGFENLHIDCIIGVHPEERVNEQTIFVDLKLKIDISKCIHSDCVTDTVDYVKLSQICTDLAKTNKFNLIETYASKVLAEIFNAYPITWGWIKVRKPKAIPQSEGAAVEIEEGIR